MISRFTPRPPRRRYAGSRAETSVGASGRPRQEKDGGVPGYQAAESDLLRVRGSYPRPSDRLPDAPSIEGRGSAGQARRGPPCPPTNRSPAACSGIATVLLQSVPPSQAKPAPPKPRRGTHRWHPRPPRRASRRPDPTTPGSASAPRIELRAAGFARSFELLGDPLRLGVVLHLARNGETHVSALCAAPGKSQTVMSGQLALMRVAGAVEARTARASGSTTASGPRTSATCSWRSCRPAARSRGRSAWENSSSPAAIAEGVPRGGRLGRAPIRHRPKHRRPTPQDEPPMPEQRRGAGVAPALRSPDKRQISCRCESVHACRIRHRPRPSARGWPTIRPGRVAVAAVCRNRGPGGGAIPRQVRLGRVPPHRDRRGGRPGPVLGPRATGGRPTPGRWPRQSAGARKYQHHAT